jgi:chitin disaccharide deacetylase
MHTSDTNRRLGYPSDARLLILNADDFGVCHAVNVAIWRSLTDGIASSTTVMAPCPWALHALRLLREHPAVPCGVHLTVICEPVHYRWGPLTCRERVPSLVDETGYFYSFERIPEFLAQVKREDLEVEFRAQIEMVLAAELRPTHLDWHCLRGGGGTAIVDLMQRLAREYGLAMRAVDRPRIATMQRQGLPTTDHVFMDSYGLETAGKFARYAQLLHDLPVGLSEWAVHPGCDDAETRAIGALGPEVRQADFEFLISAQARALIQQEGITLLSYSLLQDVWRAR